MKTYLCEFIEKKCEEAGFFMSQLSDKADISPSVIQTIKNGRTRIKPATKQKLAQALGCSIGDIQDAIRRSDEVLEDGKVVRKKVYDKPVPEKEPEPHCPYDDPVEEPDTAQTDKPWVNEGTPYMKPVIIASSTKADIPDCREGKPAPLPDFPKENPEKAEATLIRQTVENAIVVNASALAGVIKTPAEDNVNHPAHYTQGGIECIDALKASMSRDEYRGFLKGNTMKYLWRYRMKGGVEDLKKARWYLDKLISEMEEAPNE